ncbi:5-formyltetrahydrofolate cyclo-ligase [Pseudohoeflea coraliihabitans]|uniref:5-formyltetrahydrofolate cyclo-ligase n=1 Tax=Pseudohoeflea coraliihabitans TaxID=2860393 RepID=A0ABS6WK02_9HYPH|nr:5-formyltetrahydrofolate cyclo-ligase [Pseudohoeflea sp. DP4N28-3]MBW3096190.1 5-formyltetrahydrofolate cyclo-ligase [Pseudohoeflea sp. DP4N28-3]
MSQMSFMRQRIWDRLKDVARPDTRLHLDFSEFIPDFEGADRATARLLDHAPFRDSRLTFVTPDSSLTELRVKMIEAGMPFIMSTYNMCRGFLYLAPGTVPEGAARYAAWLDGMEHFARPISLAGIADLGRFDFAVTGASAVSTDGVRFGKGHTYFDHEWGIFTDLGLMDETTPVAAIVHDVQLVADKFYQSETDIAIDLIATPERLTAVDRATMRPRGVRWDLMTPAQIDTIPPLKELARMRGIA